MDNFWGIKGRENGKSPFFPEDWLHPRALWDVSSQKPGQLRLIIAVSCLHMFWLDMHKVMGFFWSEKCLLGSSGPPYNACIGCRLFQLEL